MRCTIPAAVRAMPKQRITSGMSFIWKPLPNSIDSKLPTAVKMVMNRSEDSRPANNVRGCEDVSQPLYICMPEKMSTVNIDDRARDVPLVTATIS